MLRSELRYLCLVNWAKATFQRVFLQSVTSCIRPLASCSVNLAHGRWQSLTYHLLWSFAYPFVNWVCKRNQALPPCSRARYSIRRTWTRLLPVYSSTLGWQRNNTESVFIQSVARQPQKHLLNRPTIKSPGQRRTLTERHALRFCPKKDGSQESDKSFLLTWCQLVFCMVWTLIAESWDLLHLG